MEDLKFALVQIDLIWEDVSSNLKKFDNFLTQVDSDTDVIVLPEMFSTGFSMNSKKLAEEMDGTTVKWMISRADEKNTAVLGSVIIHESEKYYNRMIWVEPNGDISFYDKKHLFKLSGEHESYTAGTKKLIVNWKGWRICPLVCYDLRFPEWSRNGGEFDILIYSANWPKPRSEHWRSLIKARAIENQCFTIGVNRIGEDGNGLEYIGATSSYDYSGGLLCESINEEKIDHVVFDKSGLDFYRMKFPFLSDQEDNSET